MQKPRRRRPDPKETLDATWWLVTAAFALAGLLVGEAIVNGYLLP